MSVEPCALYQNKGDGTFEDVAEKSGVGDSRNGRCAAFIDYDNDGDLDLFAAGCHSTARFYRNEGDGTFKEMTAKAGLQIFGHCERLTVGDYDNDGYIDAFVMFWDSAKRFYHNNGDGTFTNMAKEAGVCGAKLKAISSTRTIPTLSTRRHGYHTSWPGLLM